MHTTVWGLLQLYVGAPAELGRVLSGRYTERAATTAVLSAVTCIHRRYIPVTRCRFRIYGFTEVHHPPSPPCACPAPAIRHTHPRIKTSPGARALWCWSPGEPEAWRGAGPASSEIHYRRVRTIHIVSTYRSYILILVLPQPGLVPPPKRGGDAGSRARPPADHAHSSPPFGKQPPYQAMRPPQGHVQHRATAERRRCRARVAAA